MKAPVLSPAATVNPAARLWLPDALRFPAALGVVAFHVLLSVEVQRPTGDASTWWLGWLHCGGAFGVSLFFVLSGFGVHLGWARAHAAGRSVLFAPAEFFRKRLWRLYPAYFVALALSVALGTCWAWWRGRDIMQAVPSGVDLLTHLFLIHTLFPETFFGIVPAFWFVGVLAHLLFLYPLYLRLVARWGDGRALLLVLTVTLIYRVTVVRLAETDESRMMWLSNAPGRWFEWALGATLAAAVAAGRGLSWRVGSAALVLTPIWLGWGGGFVVLYEPVLGALLGLALWWGITSQRFQGKHRSASLTWTASVSYAVYLLHQIFVPYASSALGSQPWMNAAIFAAIFVLVLSVTLPLAEAIRRWVEPLALSFKA